MFKKNQISLLAFFALFVFSCNNTPEKGVQFEAEMLGLTPGSNIAEINFAWYSEASAANNKSFVRIFDEEGKLVETAKGVSGSASEGKLFHKVTAKHLKEGGKYKYSVSNDSINWSFEKDYNAPEAGAFRFAVVGDPQLTDATTFREGKQDPESKYFSNPATTAKGWEETVGKIAEANVNFIVSCGDQVDFYANETEYANFFAPAALRNIPIAPVMGNHDVHEYFTYHFNLPNASEGSLDMQANYFYLYNNVLFIGLNTSPYPSSKDAAIPYVNNFDNTIKAAKAANAGKYDWIVVHHHKSTQSVAVHVADMDIKYYIEGGFEKLMTKHGVDLVLSGHDHIYVRSHIVRQDSTDEFSVKSTDGIGTIYLSISTASGLKYYDPFVEDIENNPPAGMNFYSQRRTPEYTIVDVDGKNMSVKTYGIDGGIADEFTLIPSFLNRN